MPARKKSVSEVDATAETAPATAPRRRAVKAAATVEGAAEKPKAPRTKRVAATHKSAARAAAAALEVPPAFDPALHADEIRREAYYQWLNRGCAHGDDAGDWFRAVEAVKTRYGY
jgi:hypothetical protein